MNNNTVPEKRINKLGHVVTKHVAVQKNAVEPRPSIPAPQVKTPAPKRADLGSLFSRVADESNYIHIYYPNDIAGRLTERLSKLSDDTIRIINEAESWDRNENRGQRLILMVHAIISCDEDKLRETLTFMPHVPSGSETSEAVDLIQGLRGIERFKNHDHLESLEGQDHETAVAFIRTAEAVWAYAGGTHISYDREDEPHRLYINDKELASLVESNPHRADAMVEYLMEREEVDVAGMNEYLNTTVPLRDGTL